MAPGIRILRDQVAAAVGGGASLDEVDHDVIRAAPVSGELRDALWLYAWGLSERERQPPAAVELLRSE